MNNETITRMVAIDELRENAENPRKISGEQLRKLTVSLLMFRGMMSLRPIAANEGNVILGGNMRYRALNLILQMSEQELREAVDNNATEGMTDAERERIVQEWLKWQQDPQVEVVAADGLSEEQTDEFVIKDNVQFGEWDVEKLKGDFAPMKLMGWGLQQTELPVEVMMDTTDTDADEADELRVIIVYAREQSEAMAKHVGLETIDKGTYLFKDGKLE